MVESQSKHSLRVLLIEDDEDDFILIRGLLAEIAPSVMKAELKWASAFDTALEEYRNCKHDVYLLDYRLGERDGLDFLREVNGNDCGGPVIFLTGHGDYEVDVEAMKAGAADYLIKDSLTAPLLERSIRYTMERARSEKALREARSELERRVRERTTELAAANAELKRNSEKIKLFAYSVSHDLKSPVMSIHGLAKRLQERHGHELGSKGKEYCDQILNASRQIVSVIEKTNLYISVKETAVQVETVRLKELLEVVRDEFSPQVESRGIRWSEPESDPVIRVDGISLIRVLRNLVDNALKYGGETLSEIEIQYREKEDYHVLSVKDDGVGIEEDDPKRIFGLFKRRKCSRGIEGAGLGLAIVKEIAEQHKGTAWMEVGRKRGTIFHLSISKNL